jgi:hypothetical protein
MLRINKWSGLLTQASPYSIPPGAAQRQINFILSAPGQISSRDGMVPINFRSGRAAVSGVIEQAFPVSGGMGSPDRVLVIDSEGNIDIVNGALM